MSNYEADEAREWRRAARDQYEPDRPDPSEYEDEDEDEIPPPSVHPDDEVHDGQRYADLFGALLAVADDYEAQTLEDLALRAGYLWRCRLSAWVNRYDAVTCGECGLPRDECEVDTEQGPSAAELAGDYGINGRDRNV